MFDPTFTTLWIVTVDGSFNSAHLYALDAARTAADLACWLGRSQTVETRRFTVEPDSETYLSPIPTWQGDPPVFPL